MSAPKRPGTGAIDQVQQQHEEIRASIADIHRTLAEQESSPSELAGRLSAFYAVLENHFRTEESGGFFNEITEQAPRLSTKADRLCEDHQTMLNQAKSLAKQAVDGDGSRAWRFALNESFHAFSKQLMHHESEENDLLQQAYTEDIGSND